MIASMGSTDRATPTSGLRFLYWLLGIFCFNRISILGAELLPKLSVCDHGAQPSGGPYHLRR